MSNTLLLHQKVDFEGFMVIGPKNALLEKEVDELVNAQRYERSRDR